MCLNIAKLFIIADLDNYAPHNYVLCVYAQSTMYRTIYKRQEGHSLQIFSLPM